MTVSLTRFRLSTSSCFSTSSRLHCILQHRVLFSCVSTGVTRARGPPPRGVAGERESTGALPWQVLASALTVMVVGRGVCYCYRDTKRANFIDMSNSEDRQHDELHF